MKPLSRTGVLIVHTPIQRLLRLGAAFAVLATAGAAGEASSLLNVSYDVTREYHKEVNTTFAQRWKAKSGEVITINQSHG